MARLHHCEDCGYFMENDILNPDSGECHRRAPYGADASGMSVAVQQRAVFTAGRVSDTLFSEVPVYLNKDQFALTDTTDPLPVGAGVGDGFHDNTITMFSGAFNYKVAEILVVASRLNTGAATVGVAPTINIALATISGTSTSILHNVEVPITGAGNVNPFNAAGDDLVRFRYVLPVPLEVGGRTLGFWIELDDTNSEDKIAQCRNPMITLTVGVDTPQSNPFSLLDDKTTFWCGQFRKASAPQTEKCWTCDYFNPLNPGVDNTGQCRFHAPRKFDQATIPSMTQPAKSSLDYSLLFANIEDGNDNFCGDYKPSVDTPPDPV